MDKCPPEVWKLIIDNLSLASIIKLTWLSRKFCYILRDVIDIYYKRHIINKFVWDYPDLYENHLRLDSPKSVLFMIYIYRTPFEEFIKYKYDYRYSSGKHYYLNGLLHHDNDGPAIEQINGDKLWYQNGLKHRDGDKPACEFANGAKEWYKYGQLYCDAYKPAIIDVYGNQYWYQNGQVHRDYDKPAIEYANGNKQWYQYGRIHRDDDKPAIEYITGYKEWYQNGKFQYNIFQNVKFI